MSPSLCRVARLLACLTLTSSALAYTDPQYDFTATAPAGWRQSSYAGTAVVFLAPRAVSGFNPNINVLVQDLPAGMTLKAYDDLTLGQIKTYITDGKIISHGNATLGGVPARRLTYMGRQGQATLFFTQVYAVFGQQAYVLTGTTVQGHEASMESALAGFAKSFKHKP